MGQHLSHSVLHTHSQHTRVNEDNINRYNDSPVGACVRQCGIVQDCLHCRPHPPLQLQHPRLHAGVLASHNNHTHTRVNAMHTLGLFSPVSRQASAAALAHPRRTAWPLCHRTAWGRSGPRSCTGLRHREHHTHRCKRHRRIPRGVLCFTVRSTNSTAWMPSKHLWQWLWTAIGFFDCDRI